MTCRICRDAPADKYTWCRPCIKRAARGAAKYFITDRTRELLLSGDRVDVQDYMRRQTNKWEKKFRKRLRAALP